MRVEKQEGNEEESHRRDTFETAQEERFILVHEHMTSRDNNFNNFPHMLRNSLMKFVKTYLLTMVPLKPTSITRFIIKIIITITINNFTGRCMIFWMLSMEIKVSLGIGVED